MSTRCTTSFYSGDDTIPEAIIYRHTDGYPEGAGADLIEFLDDLEKNVPDNRFDDPAYLAAKYVVFLARMFNTDYAGNPKEHPLDFLSVGVCKTDPDDIAFRYEVRCGVGRPVLKCFDRAGHLVNIPAPQPATPPLESANKPKC